MTIKNTNCIKKPMVLRIVKVLNYFSYCEIFTYYLSKLGISKHRQNINVTII
jgi:hypothetical protein